MRKFKKGKKARMQNKHQSKRFSKQTVWAIAIVLLMTLSVFGFMWVSPGGSSLEYNGLDFKPVVDPQTGITNVWIAKINGEKVEFYHYPEELAYLELGRVHDVLSGKDVISLTYDVNDSNKEIIGLMSYELAQVLPSHEKSIIGGFTSENEFGKQVIGCSDASPQNPVVYIKSGSENSIKIEEDCIIVEAVSLNFFRQARDIILLMMLGVM